MGIWNVRGINGIIKRDIGRCIRKGKFELFVLTETKLNRNKEVSWHEVNDIADVQEIERANECVAILMSETVL